MKEGDKVQVFGVWTRDGENEGKPGVFQGYESFRGDEQGKVVVKLDYDGTVVSCDPGDVGGVT